MLFTRLFAVYMVLLGAFVTMYNVIARDVDVFDNADGILLMGVGNILFTVANKHD